MKILFVGSFDSWKKLHLEHLISGYRQAGFDVLAADKNKMSKFHGLPLPEKMAEEQRQRSLEQIIKRHSPDICFFPGTVPFDIKRLKSYYKGLVIFHDYDGPRRSDLEKFCKLSRECLFLTVSRYVERELKKRECQCFYLPHGVDTEYYDPSHGSQNTYSADISFIGRATDRRVSICASCNMDIALYGDRWKKTSLAGMCRSKKNIYEKEVVSIYRDSTAMINILQEPLEQFQTIMSLQCFAITSTAGCLCAEFVEEFPEAFEENKEVLLFRTPEELPELLQKVIKDKKLAAQTGAAARQRCLAEHTHRHRAIQLKKLIS